MAYSDFNLSSGKENYVHIRSSVAMEPIHRRRSVATEPVYRRSSVTMEPVYRRSSVAAEPVLRRDMITMQPDLTKEPAEQMGRRGSRDADHINWIEKYKKSDHHTDRLVSAKLEYEKAIGRSLSDQLPNQLKTTTRSSAAVVGQELLHPKASVALPLSSLQPLSRPPPPHPFRYEATSKLTVFLQPARNYSSSSSLSSSFKRITEPHRSTSQKSTGPQTDFFPGRISLSSSSSTPLHPAAGSSAASSYIRYRRPSSPDFVATSLPQDSLFRRRYSVDSGSPKSTDYLHRTERSFSPVGASEPKEPRRSSGLIQSTRTEPYRPSFTRAPSLPPNFSTTAGFPTVRSAELPQMASYPIGSGYLRRSSLAGLNSTSSFLRRSSLANISDLSVPNYRRITDFGAFKSASNSHSRKHQSTSGTDFRRRSSHDTPSLYLSPLPPSSNPPPSERIFGTRNTHSSIQRIRKSIADG